MINTRTAMVLIASVCMLSLIGSGCRKDESAQGKTPTPEEQVKASAKLVAADAHDGKPDKVVSECLMCGLRMSGSADHASTYEGVSLHFCKAGCKSRFDKDPVGALLVLEIE